MVFPPLRMRPAAAAAGLVFLTSCGAGVIAAVAGNDSGSGARPPQLTIPNNSAPLVPLVRDLERDFRAVLISNLELPVSTILRVELRAPDLGATAEQDLPLIISDPAETTVVGLSWSSLRTRISCSRPPTAR